jgi:hypothetical protein
MASRRFPWRGVAARPSPFIPLPVRGEGARRADEGPSRSGPKETYPRPANTAHNSPTVRPRRCTGAVDRVALRRARSARVLIRFTGLQTIPRDLSNTPIPDLPGGSSAMPDTSGARWRAEMPMCAASHPEQQKARTTSGKANSHANACSQPTTAAFFPEARQRYPGPTRNTVPEITFGWSGSTPSRSRAGIRAGLRPGKMPSI